MPGIATPEFAVPFSAAGGLGTGVVATPFWMAPCDCLVLGVIGRVGTAPVGSALILNLQTLRASDGSTTALLYNNSGSPDARPTVADGKKYTFAEATGPALPYSPYALNNPTPGGAVNAPATKSVTYTPTPAAPDLNAILYTGDLLYLDVVAVGSGTAGSDLFGVVHLLKN